jgi:hypothetical protein
MTGLNMAVFAEMLEGSVGISVAQTMLTTQLSRDVKSSGSTLGNILQRGVTNIKEGFGSEQLDIAIDIFSRAIPIPGPSVSLSWASA